ncbi:MAG: hypothetical protein ACI9D0_002149, partial [Bacteroidia bacterium]
EEGPIAHGDLPRPAGAGRACAGHKLAVVLTQTPLGVHGDTDVGAAQGCGFKHVDKPVYVLLFGLVQLALASLDDSLARQASLECRALDVDGGLGHQLGNQRVLHRGEFGDHPGLDLK